MLFNIVRDETPIEIRYEMNSLRCYVEIKFN